jgi:hypothetical protein
MLWETTFAFAEGTWCRSTTSEEAGVGGREAVDQIRGGEEGAGAAEEEGVDRGHCARGRRSGGARVRDEVSAGGEEEGIGGAFAAQLLFGVFFITGLLICGYCRHEL